jgi:hypothetical protein
MRKNYITTFLEQDIPQLGINIPATTLRRFWIMLAHYHGQVLNYSELGRSFGISDVTARKYIDILTGTFMVRLLQPWFSNSSKRQVKSPKVYLRDSGVFHSLTGIASFEELSSNPKIGASWEGFALEQIAEIIEKSNSQLFFWGTHSGAEIDLFFISNGKNYGVEFKYTSTPKVSKSMRSAIEDLDLDHLWIVVPNTGSFKLAANISVVSLGNFKQI